MKNNILNIFNKFNEGLKAAVIYDAKSSLNKNTKTKLFFGFFLAIYILSKPFYYQYIGYLVRKKKIEDLKREGKFILNENI